jgi:ribulose-phosphate 3-epimerase
VTKAGNGEVQIAPSILSADFTALGAEIDRVSAVADWVHVDVMDNHFVPNLTLGLPVVEGLVKRSGAPLDCHLMIDNPDRWAPAYAEVGAGSVTFHVEAAHAPVRLARQLRSLGARAGMALKPATSIEAYADMLPEVDMVLLMTVEPGFGGQAFLDVVLPKIERTRALLRSQETPIWLQVDGGIGPQTIERAAAAGADVFVAGSAVFEADDPATAVEQLRRLATNASPTADQ